MRRQLTLIIGCLILVVGWLGVFSLRNLPPGYDLFWLAPMLILGIGLGLMMKIVRWPLTAFTAVLSGCLSLFILQSWPMDRLLIGLIGLHPQGTPAKLSPMILHVPDELRTGRYKIPRLLYLPKGWKIELIAKAGGHPRALEFDGQGNLYASLPEEGRIEVFKQEHQQISPLAEVYATGLDRPYGLTWQEKGLIVAHPTGLDRLVDADLDMRSDHRVPVVSGLPDGEGHWARSVVDDGVNLFIGVGASCNACVEGDQRRATVLKVDAQSGETEVFASGLRFPAALYFSSIDQALWSTEVSRSVPDGIPPGDELNRLLEGRDYGWPHCVNRQYPDSSWGTYEQCQQTQAPVALFPPEFKPLGMVGAKLSGDGISGRGFFVTSQGRGDGQPENGYALYWLPRDTSGNLGAVIPIVVGWQFRGQIWGHPIAPIIGPDGALYIADQRNGGIYRITAPQAFQEG